jgi:EAL domain-containing protein (putative c-di-GMP-specific phosphodiesterase class I)
MGVGSARFIPQASSTCPNGVIGQSVVYLVDDMARNFQFIVPLLEEVGYRAVLCSSRAEFAAQFLPEQAAAVFIDVHVGDDEDATDMLDVVRKAGGRSSLFLMSGDPAGMESMRRYAEEIGLSIKASLTKPFTGRNLLDHLVSSSATLHDVFAEVDVEECIARGWIYPVLQPKLDLASATFRSAELLSRMNHPELGVIAPQAFIGQMSLAQRNALFMHNLSFFADSLLGQAAGEEGFRINVNADLETLFACRADMRALAARHPHFYRDLVVEITEESLVDLQGEALKLLFKLSLDGVRFSIDDFGTGFSNYSRLTRLPVAEIKIDRSIVAGCALSRERGIMVRSMIGMGRELGFRVVAEGVETLDDLSFLKSAQCDEIQGFLIARPMTLESFQDFLTGINPLSAMSLQSGICAQTL